MTVPLITNTRGWPIPTALSLLSLNDSIRYLKGGKGMGPTAQVEELSLDRRDR